MKTGSGDESYLIRAGSMEGWSLGENSGNCTEDMLSQKFTKMRLKADSCFLTG